MQAFLKTGKISAADKPSSSGVKTTSKKKPPAPWVEKYRPKTIDDIVDQGEVVQVLRECLSGGDLPHLLFYGPPGTGKTSAILAAARQLFGDITRDRVLELNASDERGIQVVRDKVKTFAQMTVSSTKPDGQPCPPYKLVILDEADSMTNAAQAALRRTMERETRTTRFCLICNYVSRIIPPITSRCSKFRFKPLARDNVIKRLREICEAEGVDVGEGEVLHKAVDTCEGDLRRALTALQCCQRLLGKITDEGLIEVTGLVPEKLVNEYLSVNNYSELEKFVENFLMEAYSASQLLEQLSATVITAGHLTNKQKCVISEKLAVCSHRLLDGGAEFMQLTDLGCTIIMANNNP
ncbi:replication factor C subunit 4 [Amyelois transitella]|uniref:replication factor C subunit 4 n=1 Tax=Amyelois transitella TaxID=680683 RepID=UPI0029903F4E|nr:replication factor C subunit 4 [Amyelois transitella]